MKNIKRYVTMAVAGVMMLSFAGCNIVERTPETIQKTVYAKVGSTKITKADVDDSLKSYLDQYKQQYGDDFESNDQLKDTLKEMRTKALDSLIDNEVLMQSKETLGVNPTDDEIQEQVDERVNYYKNALGSDEQYQAFLENYGYDDDSFADFWKKQVVIQMIQDKILEGTEIPEEDIENYYNENLDTYKGKAGAEVTHLLFMPEKDESGNATEEADAKAKSLADSARAQAVAGKSLKELSESDEFKASAKYEELGRVAFENSGMVQEFEDAFKSLPVNQVSDVVKTSYGYHIIVNTATYADDEVTPLNDALKESIKGNLLNEKQQEVYESKLEELKENVKIKKYEDRL